jgi:hypothetical protein
MNEQQLHHLFIYEKIPDDDEDDFGYKILTKISLKNMEYFQETSLDFFFKLQDGLKDPDSLIFANKFRVFELNFKSE